MRTGHVTLGIAAAALLLGLPACASHRPMEKHQTQVEQEAVATIDAINVPERLVTLRGPKGNQFIVRVDESVTDFPRGRVGDQVRIRYYESFAVQMKKPGEGVKGLEVTEETSKAKPGTPAKEGAKIEAKATVKIEAVDKSMNTVTFTGPRGRRTVQIYDASLQEFVRKLRPGDEVEVTYTEALAVALEPVKK